MILIGELALWVALLMAAWSAITSYAGGMSRRADLVLSGERGMRATFVLIFAAAAGLWSALLSRDFSFQYVAAHTTANLPPFYAFSAFWIGRSGVLLLAVLLLSSAGVIALSASRRDNPELRAFVCGTLATLILMVLAAVCFGGNPYERLGFVAPDGIGMHPRLQHPAASLQTPSLYIGYATALIPFAFTIATLVASRPDDQWIDAVRRWSLASWFFLGVGILLGMWAGYSETGDSSALRKPVENGSLLLWLTTTALLHTIVATEVRVTWRSWNLPLVMATFAITISIVITGNFGDASADGAGQTGGGLIRRSVAVTLCVLMLLFIAFMIFAMRTRTPKTSARRSRYGRNVAHAGVAALVIGMLGVSFRSDREVRLQSGAALTQRDPFGREWTFASQGASRFQSSDRKITAVTVQATRNGKRIGLISSEERQYVDSRDVPTFEPVVRAGMRKSIDQDVSVVLLGIADDETATARISFIPLITWLWIGAAMIVVGGLLIMWPSRDERAAST